MAKNRSQRAKSRKSRLRSSNYFKWKNSPKKSARIKQMIFALSKNCDDECWPYPNLPWHPHPFAYDWRAESSRDKAMLRKAKKLLSESAYKELLYILNDSLITNQYDIVFADEVTGNLQVSGAHFDHEYVDQYENGGYTGDSYAGWLYLPITPKRYFKFHYSD